MTNKRDISDLEEIVQNLLEKNKLLLKLNADLSARHSEDLAIIADLEDQMEKSRGLLCADIDEKTKQIEELESKLSQHIDRREQVSKLREALEYYATHRPYQFPDGYYEICLEEGFGGHDKFGKLARTTLRECFPEGEE